MGLLERASAKFPLCYQYYLLEILNSRSYKPFNTASNINLVSKRSQCLLNSKRKTHQQIINVKNDRCDGNIIPVETSYSLSVLF